MNKISRSKRMPTIRPNRVKAYRRIGLEAFDSGFSLIEERWIVDRRIESVVLIVELPNVSLLSLSLPSAGSRSAREQHDVRCGKLSSG